MAALQWMQMLFAAASALAAGLLCASAALEWREAPERAAFSAAAAALPALIAAAAGLLLQLGRPELLLAAMARPGSALFAEVLGLGIAFASALIYGALLWRGADWRAARAWILAAAASAAVLPAAIGAGLIMPWRAAWNTVCVALPLPGLFILIAALAYAGIARLWGLSASARVPAAGFAASLLGWLAYLAALGISADPEAREALRSALTGEPAALFWPMAALAWLPAAALAALDARRATDTPSRRIAAGYFAAALSAALAAGLARGLLGALGLPAWHFFVR